MKKIALVLISFIALSCTTTDLITNTISNSDKAKIDICKMQILDFILFNSDYQLQKADETLKEYILIETRNKKYKASIIGLNAYVEYLKDETINTKATTNDIRDLNSTEETSYIIESLKLSNNKAISKLEQGLNQNPKSLLIRDRLQYLYTEEENFTEAAIEQNYLAVNSYNRNQFLRYSSLAKHNTMLVADGDSDLRKELLVEQTIKLEECLELIKESVESYNNYSIKKLYKTLRESSAIYNKSLKLNTVLKRKEIAHLLARLYETDITPFIEYETYFEDLESPIEDIKTDEYYFSSVLYLIENNYLDLIDGSYFKPERFATSKEFINTLDKIYN